MTKLALKRRTVINLLKSILLIIGVTALLVGGFCAVQAFSGRMDVSATGEHGALPARLLEGTREAAVRRNARDVAVQMPDLDDPASLLEAVVGFEDMCAVCHVPPGGDPSSLSRGLNPPATDLTRAAEHRTPAELFWVTKHGIRMTGMPAWGPTHTDAELWPVVALVTRFPGFGPADYGELLSEARAAGVEHHHDHDHDHDHDHHHDDGGDETHDHHDHEAGL